MKKITLLTTILLITLLAGNVNASEWLAAMGGTNGDYGRSVISTNDGSFVVSGDTQSYGSGSNDFWISKFDNNNNELWSKTLGGSNSENGFSVTESSDGGYVIVGRTQSYGSGINDVLIAKFDSDGSELWSKTFGGSSYNYGYSVVSTTDGGFVFTGYTSSHGAGSNDILLSKFNSSGKEEWSVTLGGTETDNGNSVVSTTDGGYVVTGETMSYGSSGFDVFLSKFNSSGKEEWTKTFGSPEWDYGNSVASTIDGGFVVTGQTSINGTNSILVAKFNSNGEIEWIKTFSGVAKDYGNSVASTIDGGFLVVGDTESYGSGYYDILLSKFNSSGEAEWTKVFGGPKWDYGNSVTSTIDGGFVITGHTSSYGNGSTDVLLAKFDSSGNIENCTNGNIQDISDSWHNWETVVINNTLEISETDQTGNFVINSTFEPNVTSPTPNQEQVCYHEFVMPLAESYLNNQRTTEFSTVENISEVENLTLATDYGVITFGNETVNAKAQDYDSNVVFGDCFVAVNSANLDSSFNATAYLLMNNSDGHCGDNTILTSNDFAADAGAVKTSANICKDCEYLSKEGGLDKYRVPHFSSYAIGSNSNLTIDANDPKAVNQTVTFTAVYRNSTSGDSISGATCDIGLPNGTVTGMVEGTSEYTYQTSFTSNGTYTYNVTCSATGYQTLKTDDNFTITEQVQQIPEFNGIAILALLAIIGIMIYKYQH